MNSMTQYAGSPRVHTPSNLTMFSWSNLFIRLASVKKSNWKLEPRGKCRKIKMIIRVFHSSKSTPENSISNVTQKIYWTDSYMYAQLRTMEDSVTRVNTFIVDYFESTSHFVTSYLDVPFLGYPYCPNLGVPASVSLKPRSYQAILI